MMPTDLQKKDELRRELRLLMLVQDVLRQTVDPANVKHELVEQQVTNRIEDIGKALED